MGQYGTKGTIHPIGTNQGETVQMATNWKEVIGTLESETERVKEAKEAASDTFEAKVGRTARTLTNLLTSEEAAAVVKEDDPVMKSFFDRLDTFGAFGPQVVELSNGNKLAERLANQLRTDEEDRSAAFNQISAEAAKAVEAWQTLTKRARSGRSGESTTDPQQLLKTFGIDTIRGDLVRPDGSTFTFTHGTTWSSVTDRITWCVRGVLGADPNNRDGSIAFGKVDPKAATAWLGFKADIKAGNAHPVTFDVNTDKGVVKVHLTPNAING